MNKMFPTCWFQAGYKRGKRQGVIPSNSLSFFFLIDCDAYKQLLFELFIFRFHFMSVCLSVCQTLSWPSSTRWPPRRARPRRIWRRAARTGSARGMPSLKTWRDEGWSLRSRTQRWLHCTVILHNLSGSGKIFLKYLLQAPSAYLH